MENLQLLEGLELCSGLGEYIRCQSHFLGCDQRQKRQKRLWQKQHLRRRGIELQHHITILLLLLLLLSNYLCRRKRTKLRSAA